MRLVKQLLETFHDWVAPYDQVRRLRFKTDRAYHGLAALCLVIFLGLMGLLVLGSFVDNKPTTASTGLVTAHRMVTLNPGSWFREDIWWVGKQTPTPLPFTIHGAFFAIFGFTVRGILGLHIVVGTLAAALLYRITVRRYGAPTGLLAMSLYLIAPLPLYVTLSGWTFIWATFFLLLTVDLLDRAVLTRHIPWYLLAGFTLGCAGMSRPENYAVAALVVLFVNIPIRYRALFLMLTFLYPLAQFTHNNLYLGESTGLRILDDARSEITYVALFQEWFRSVQRHILDRNFAPFLQWLLIPAVCFFGIPRHRFLTALLAYFCVAFFAAYAMRRISFNHEGYYYVHVALFMPFLAALLIWITTTCAAILRRVRFPGKAAQGVAVLALGAILTTNVIVLREAYADRLFYRASEPAREVRDYLRGHLAPEDRLVLDYFSEVSWMLAEIEGPGGRETYFYNTNPSGIPRPPLNAARKDIGTRELVALNDWVGENYRRWCGGGKPRFVVTQNDGAWARERDKKHSMGHYRMFSLRPALGTDTWVPLLDGRIVLENDEYVIIERGDGAGTMDPVP